MENTKPGNNNYNGNPHVWTCTLHKTHDLVTMIDMAGGYKEIHLKENTQPDKNGNLGVQV
jgi:hypothetical protein